MTSMTVDKAIWVQRARTLSFFLLAMLVAASIGVLLAANPAHAATFTVNRTGDESEPVANRGDGVCDVLPSTAGNQCSLRAAIQESNANNNDATVVDLIRFNIVSAASVKTISPNSPLPTITEAITINGYTQSGASANTLAEGNDAVLKIQLNGTNAGTFADGLLIQASNSTIKGLVINRFFGNGVSIETSGATGNKVPGNFIGTNATGNTGLANGNDGVDILNARNTTVGGTQSAQRNVISGNVADGVEIGGSGARGNKVQGNFIGTKKVGTGDLGNDGDGVQIGGAPNNTIGGTASGARNVISDNRFGVLIQASGATGNKVQGNKVQGNDGDGVLISTSGALDNTIGGESRDAGNVISGNGGGGVKIVEATGNSVLSNRIFENVGLGIDLFPDGVTNNDPEANEDSDTGPNNLQNFPLITSVTQSSSFFNPTTIRGTLNSNPNQDFTVQCFLADDPADTSGHGEGQGFVAEDTTVTTDADGNASFECNFLFPQSLEGKKWSSTATNEATGDTSEFSANFPVG